MDGELSCLEPPELGDYLWILSAATPLVECGGKEISWGMQPEFRDKRLGRGKPSGIPVCEPFLELAPPR